MDGRWRVVNKIDALLNETSTFYTQYNDEAIASFKAQMKVALDLYYTHRQTIYPLEGK